jgi:hypothetical protein
VDAPCSERRSAIDVVAVPAVAAVDDRVAGREQGREALDGAPDERRWDHDPDVPRRLERGHDLLQRRRADDGGGARHTVGVGGHHGGHRLGVDIVGHAAMAPSLEASHHVGAHAAESDHRDLHGCRLPRPAIA